MSEHPFAEQWKRSPSISLPFDQFQSMDMALNDAVAVLKRESRLDRSFVSLDPIRKADEFRDLAAMDLFQPYLQLLSLYLPFA